MSWALYDSVVGAVVTGALCGLGVALIRVLFRGIKVDKR